MALSVAIIGAGWYGCHIGVSLQALGFEVTLFDRHARPLHEASGNNQFRLHQGFHYPRHHGTRVQSRDGFLRFIERYPTLSREVAENIYAVPREESLIDFQTYRLIMTASGIDFRETETASIGLANVDGMMLVGERVLLIDRARRYFAERLGSALQLGQEVRQVVNLPDRVMVDGTRFDLLVDASWGHCLSLPMHFFYEPTLLLYYEARADFPAVTLVDGPLCSVYPTEDPGLYTLSSVLHTPLGRTENSAAARLLRDSAGSATITEKTRAMEDQIARYIPGFRDIFRFAGPQFAIKSKPVGSFDDRSCYVFRDGRVFNVMSGKIDTIFFAVERILSFLQSGETPAEAGGGTLRHEIRRGARA